MKALDRQLLLATKAGSLTDVATALASGARGDVADLRGETAASIAAGNGSEPILRSLLESGVGLAWRGFGGESLGHRAVMARGGTEPCVRLLRDYGWDPNEKDHDGETAAHIAAAWGKRGALNALLQMGSNPNARDNKGAAPAHHAAIEGFCECLRDLLNAGADIEARDCLGMAPGHWAAAEGDAKALRLLLEAGWDPNARSGHKGKTAGHCALAAPEKKAGACFLILLEFGWKQSSKNAEGKTALELARSAKIKISPILAILEAADASEREREMLQASLDDTGSGSSGKRTGI